MKKYYIAYGSNLHIPQMEMRCPDAILLGTATLEGWELLFRGSKTGSYLTIEKNVNGKVPVAIWEVTPMDEAALNRYEGFPTFYYKQEFKLRYKDIFTDRKRTVKAFAYIMHEDRPIGVPSNYYMSTCLSGYKILGFDKKLLTAAYKKCKEMCKNEKK